jgi:hypothetical protein
LNNRTAARHFAAAGRYVIPFLPAYTVLSSLLGVAAHRSGSGLATKAPARKHGPKSPPKKVARLEANGKLNEGIQGAAIGAHREIEDRMQQGVSAA